MHWDKGWLEHPIILAYLILFYLTSPEFKVLNLEWETVYTETQFIYLSQPTWMNDNLSTTISVSGASTLTLNFKGLILSIQSRATHGDGITYI